MRTPLSYTAKTIGSPGVAQRGSSAGTDALTLRLLVGSANAAERRTVRDAAGPQFEVIEAESAVAASALLAACPCDLVLLDAGLPQNSGVALVAEIVASFPRTDIVVLTSFATASLAMDAMRAGASDYLTKPFTEHDLQQVLERAIQRLQLDLQSRLLRERLRTATGMGPLIGTSSGMERIYRILSKVALSHHPALILGENGSGKEAVARAIHESGPNASSPFILVDCAALPAEAVEAELFGVARSANQKNTRACEGALIAAGNGTVFLDEVGELPSSSQSKLLRALQNHAVQPVGAADTKPFSARVLAASSANLMEKVEQGQFRKDLYFRMNVVKLSIPPLRDRREDIPMLAQHFLEQASTRRSALRSFSDESLKLLCDYSWPGNVRELQAAVERMSSISSGPVLHAVDLPTQLQDFRAHLRTEAAAASEAEDSGPTVLSIGELEKQAILGTICQLNGDKLLAAKLLGIGKTTLYRKLKEYGEEC